jgi:serine/threonine protein kinase
VNQRLDRYELVAELASGGMATVFLGRILGVGGFQRFVAIKRLHPHLAHEQEFVEMFLDEARLAASIHHPNVVSILEVGTSDRGYYLVMEYIEGDTLARLLARATTSRERIPVPIVIRIVLDTLAGLQAAHDLKDDNEESLGLVHRDVSPQNILVGINGTSRITDFGVARAATRLSSTRSGQLKGKLAYMAPEQARGGTIDRRADLFAIGTVLWEVLADKRLFKGEGEADTLNRVLFEPIPRLSEVVPNIAPELEAVTMKALERNMERRHGSAAEMAEALERAAEPLDAIASVREVAEYVQLVMGQDIAQQREAVRNWLAQSEPSRTDLERRDSIMPGAPVASSSVSSAAMSIPPDLADLAAAHTDPITQVTRARRRRRRAWAGVLGAFVALIGAGWAWRASLRDRFAPPRASASTALVPTLAPHATDSPPGPATPASARAVASGHSETVVIGRGVSVQQLPTVAEPRPAAAPVVVRRPRPREREKAPPPVDDIPHNPYR